MHAGVFNLLQSLLPQHGLSALVYRLARSTKPWLKNLLIRRFCQAYSISLAEAEHGRGTGYASFNAFFTRALKPGARPVDPAPDVLVSPVDGRVSQAGIIGRGQILQAKGRSYSVAALLCGDPAAAERYDGGAFATLYLAPHNYHRVHMPCDGRLLHMRHVPGRLFSVNEASVVGVENLFARNERVVCEFEGTRGAGRFVVCLVGALFVGSMETEWHGAVTPAARREVTDFDYSAMTPPLALALGAEMGRFNMGSTVILLFEPGRVAWDRELLPGAEVRMGRRIGRLVNSG